MAFAGKHLLITGGSDGIGKALVQEFLQKGASHIVVLDVNEFTSSGSSTDKITFFKTDVSDVEQVRQSFRDAIALLGHLDIVIANAGICNEFDPNRVIHVNLIGVMNTNYTALELLSKTNGGQGALVLNNASVSGLDIFHCSPSYVAAKHGVVGFTRSIGDEFYFDKHGVKFVAFCPGFTETSLSLNTRDQAEVELLCSKMGMQKAEDVATAVATIAAGDAKNGSIWIIDKGVFTEVEMKTYWRKC